MQQQPHTAVSCLLFGASSQITRDSRVEVDLKGKGEEWLPAIVTHVDKGFQRETTCVTANGASTSGTAQRAIAIAATAAAAAAALLLPLLLLLLVEIQCGAERCCYCCCCCELPL